MVDTVIWLLRRRVGFQGGTVCVYPRFMMESRTKKVGEYVQGLRRLVGQERAVGACGEICDVSSLARWRFWRRWGDGKGWRLRQRLGSGLASM